MKVQLNGHAIAMLNALSSVVQVSGYRAQDLLITATIGNVTDKEEEAGFNGRLSFKMTALQSCGEFEAAAVISEAGQIVTNSYFLSQLPDINNGVWHCDVRNNKLHVVGGGQKYDFDIGEPSLHRYEPNFCDTPIDISHFAGKIQQYSQVVKGFVNRKSQAVTTAGGAVKISGLSDKITFEATNLQDAVYGEIDLDAPNANEWRLLLPVQQFESWGSLPHNAFPMTIGVDADHQLTIKCGPVTIQHNTLTNLIDSTEDVAQLAEVFRAFSGSSLSDEELASMKFAMKYQPSVLNQLVSNAVLYADGDPTLILDGETSDGGVNIIVRTVTVDSEIMMRDLEMLTKGQMSVNKGSLALINKIAGLSTLMIDPNKPETYMVMRVINDAVMVASPDGKWLAMTGETSI
jgi:hypothetical protein